ncbi:MAG: bis-aminopropyl spermidine synthase family protein [Patescibacteria group bacterium]
MLFEDRSFKLILDIAKSRPRADHSVEQYLMTGESLYIQLGLFKRVVSRGQVLFLGDDDHFSIVSALYTDIKPTVLEIDDRVIKSLRKVSRKCNLTDYTVIKHDIRSTSQSIKQGHFDCVVANPPYSSKNKAYGIKLWISRGLYYLKKGGVLLLILPMDRALPWSISNILIAQAFLVSNRCFLFDVDGDAHTYKDLPDIGLRSCNFWCFYMGGATNLFPNLRPGENPYR